MYEPRPNNRTCINKRFNIPHFHSFKYFIELIQDEDTTSPFRNSVKILVSEDLLLVTREGSVTSSKVRQNHSKPNHIHLAHTGEY